MKKQIENFLILSCRIEKIKRFDQLILKRRGLMSYTSKHLRGPSIQYYIAWVVDGGGRHAARRRARQSRARKIHNIINIGTSSL